MKANSKGWTSLRWLVGLLSLLVAAACSGGTTSSSSTEPTSGASTGSTTMARHADVLGRGEHPSYVVQAPSSWTADGFFVTNDAVDQVLGISVWAVGKVPRNPCHPLGHLYDPGPTVNDLASALASQPMRSATAPTDVTLAGYSGKYLTWSVPADMKVTGDADFSGCDVQSNGHRDFVSWLGNGGDGERYQQVAGQIDRLWVLDVKGQRLLVDATYSPDATQAQRDEEDQIVHSLRFVQAT